MSKAMGELLAQYVVEQDSQRLPAAVIQQAKRCLLDSIGVAVAGSAKTWAQAALREVRRQGGHGQASIWLYGDRVPDTSAALVNGMFAHSMDYNDDHAGIQVGSLIPPTAAAVGEAVGASGREVLTAIALGYDVAVRLADAINSQQLYMRGFQPTAVCGVFAATAVAGRLLKLSVGQMADAFGIAASYAGGTIEFLKEGTDTKRFHVAKAAQGGVLSARLAMAGMNGPRSVFEGAFGIFNVYSEQSRPERLLAELGARYDILETSFKKYPFCDGNAPPLEATLALLQEHGIAIEQVASLHYRIKSFLVPYCIDYHGDRSRKFRPRNELDAQMSLPFCIAMGLLQNGKLKVDHFDPANYGDPRIHAIADKVDASADPELDKVPLRPMSMPSILTMTLNDGRKLSKRVDYQKGDPRNPFTDQELEEKFRFCVEDFMSAGQADQIISVIDSLDQRGDLGSLSSVLGKPGN
ncbi:MmgE/PrpD family protein [Pollutimonas bauzanensis]|uniref:2-methylcitrate dehydratase PrpD n=1 Tax=Pollutimonas bauzanensis TaxID=658167 RepID=A0A1M5M210_9BURK|nr:MmgE/PrpD family protein [Pollutimonas bauzanensis]SHG70713.1 2-methylcitrate dehydratase PrpD [Pollutimonas bauzanensis]